MSDMPEQLRLILAPPGEDDEEQPRKRATPVFVPPELADGEIGGFVSDRTNPVHYSPDKKVDKTWIPMWNTLIGQFEPAYLVRLDNASGSTWVHMPVYRTRLGERKSLVKELRLGDWITVKKYTMGSAGLIVVQEYSILKVPREFTEISIDVHIVGPTTMVMGESLMAHAIDEHGRTILLRGGPWQGLWGRRQASRKIAMDVIPYDSLIGGTLYDVLEIEPPITDEILKSAYRKKAMELHPDRNKSEDAGARFMEVKEAYELLKDPAQRAAYDFGISLMSSTFGGNSGSIDFFLGNHDLGWYAPLNSGKLVGQGCLVGGSVLVTALTSFSPVRKSGKTRVAADADGIPGLFWTDDENLP